MRTRYHLSLVVLLLYAVARAEEPPPAPKPDPAIEQVCAYAGISKEKAKELLEKSSLVFVGRYRLGKYPCVQADENALAMPIAYNVTPTHILKGLFSCEEIDFNAENAKGVEHWPEHWMDDTPYLFFFSPSEASAKTLRDPEGFFTEERRLSCAEQNAAYELKDRKTTSGRDWSAVSLNLRGKTIAKALESLSLNPKDAVRVDEPPGKLWELRYSVAAENGTVHIRLDRKIFSPNRTWDEQKILDATVASVHFENDPPAKQDEKKEEKKTEHPAPPAP